MLFLKEPAEHIPYEEALKNRMRLHEYEILINSLKQEITLLEICKHCWLFFIAGYFLFTAGSIFMTVAFPTYGIVDS